MDLAWLLAPVGALAVISAFTAVQNYRLQRRRDWTEDLRDLLRQYDLLMAMLKYGDEHAVADADLRDARDGARRLAARGHSLPRRLVQIAQSAHQYRAAIKLRPSEPYMISYSDTTAWDNTNWRFLEAATDALMTTVAAYETLTKEISGTGQELSVSQLWEYPVDDADPVE